MSHNHFQHALAMLIRLPEKNRGEKLQEFLENFDLSDSEYRQLQSLSTDSRPAKFGRIMRDGRWGDLFGQLKIISHFIDNTLLKEIWQEYFEPFYVKTRARYAAIEFLDFMINNTNLLGNQPAYTQDLLRFEQAQIKFRKGVFDLTSPLSGDTLLNHQCYTTLSLDWDIPKLMMKMSQTAPSAELQIKSRKLILLLLGDLDIPSCRYFEIDPSTNQFLIEAKNAYDAGKTYNNIQLIEKSYQDLVDLRILKSSKNSH
ncbi:MAG: hypothetical protein R3B45_04310 [Bdellovibrionota bacterium]